MRKSLLSIAVLSASSIPTLSISDTNTDKVNWTNQSCQDIGDSQFTFFVQ